MAEVSVLIVRGVEGLAVYVNNYRVAGSKPWGGGHIVQEWKVDVADFERALRSIGRWKGAGDLTPDTVVNDGSSAPSDDCIGGL